MSLYRDYKIVNQSKFYHYLELPLKMKDLKVIT